MSLVEIKGVEKSYTDCTAPLKVLRGINLELEKGETVGIFGASGSGKSTLLHILGGLDSPDTGVVKFNNEDVFKWSEEKRADFRNQKLGFVFQFYHLLSEFTAKENVMIPMMIAGFKESVAEEKAMKTLKSVGLVPKADSRPSFMSGGEQQRVAIARAVVMEPKLLVADEPTGNLDEQNGKEVWDYLQNLKTENDMTLVVASHNPTLIASLESKYKIEEGILERA